jgi:hypothetical protein
LKLLEREESLRELRSKLVPQDLDLLRIQVLFVKLLAVNATFQLFIGLQMVAAGNTKQDLADRMSVTP